MSPGSLNSKFAFVDLAFIQGLPSTIKTEALSESFSNYKFLKLEVYQYSNLWASLLVDTSYFNNTNSGSRPQIRGFYNDSIVEVYKVTNTSIAVGATGALDMSGTAYRLKVIGFIKA